MLRKAEFSNSGNSVAEIEGSWVAARVDEWVNAPVPKSEIANSYRFEVLPSGIFKSSRGIDAEWRTRTIDMSIAGQVAPNGPKAWEGHARDNRTHWSSVYRVTFKLVADPETSNGDYLELTVG